MKIQINCIKQAVTEQLKKVTDDVYCYCFKAGEQHKNLETIYDFYKFFNKIVLIEKQSL